MEEELEHKIRKEIEALEESLSSSERQIETHGERGKIDTFSIFGKVALLLIVVAMLVGGGVYLSLF